VGPVTARKLRAIGVTRLVDIRTVENSLLEHAVGSLADWLVKLAHGIDERPVEPERERKSISSETTFARDLTDPAEIERELDALAAEVAGALERKGLVARTVTLKVRYADFTTVTRSHTAQGATRSAKSLSVRARALLERTDAARRPVRLLGVGAHGLSAAA
jgi:DNA polymerase-4